MKSQAQSQVDKSHNNCSDEFPYEKSHQASFKYISVEENQEKDDES